MLLCAYLSNGERWGGEISSCKVIIEERGEKHRGLCPLRTTHISLSLSLASLFRSSLYEQCMLTDYLRESIDIDFDQQMTTEMPREHVEWSKTQSIDDDKQKIHAEQSCTYSSILNINKSKEIFASTYEHAQTWTLTRSLSNHHKRYQSAIENIHLSVPNEKISVSPQRLPSSRDRSVAISPSPHRTMLVSNGQKGIAIESNTLPMKIVREKTPQWNMAPTLIKPMRIIRTNGEFIVRI